MESLQIWIWIYCDFDLGIFIYLQMWRVYNIKVQKIQLEYLIRESSRENKGNEKISQITLETLGTT